MARRRRRTDPFRNREALKYARPIPSREFLLEVLGDYPGPVGFGRLLADLALDPELDADPLSRRLNAMRRDGQLICNRLGEYALIERMDLVRGRVYAHRDGYGFLIRDPVSGEAHDDLFVSPREMRTLMHGDRVVARVSGVDRRGREEVAVVEILERNTHRVVGRLHRERGVAFVIPDNARIHHDVLIPADAVGEAADGQIVVAEITEQPTERSQPLGRVVEILGDHMAPGMEIDVAIRAHDIPVTWPEAVPLEARAFGDNIPEAAVRNRRDLRSLPLVTIDGADARDFDDAVYCERGARGWKLFVAIADVSAYVAPGSALDSEARLRGNSVYFPERVIPMLPEALSNGLCSLNPHEDRLCMVCEMSVSVDGRVTRTQFCEAVMRSHARLTYDEVAEAVVERKKRVRRRHETVVQHLDELHALYKALQRARETRGALDLDSMESRIVFNEARRIDRIEPVVRNDAHRIIEECMVAANVAAAKFLTRHKLPLLYRVHEPPPAEKVADLALVLGEMGLRVPKARTPEPADYAALAKRIAKLPGAHLLQTLLLRSLSQAVYSPKNIGHFGLALECYAHFTSPIRRYPDLLVHRAIRHVLAGRPAAEFTGTDRPFDVLGEHCSMTERRADDATRDAVVWLKCEFMMDKIGEDFTGLVSGVTSFGVFVQLNQVYVEGLVHVSGLGNDYFHYDPKRNRLEGERTGMSFGLADEVTVKVARVDLDERKIDLELLSPRPRDRARTLGRGSKRRGRPATRTRRRRGAG